MTRNKLFIDINFLIRLLSSVHCVQSINDQYHNSYSNAECSKKHDFSSFCFSRWLLPVEFSISKIIFIILKMIFYWVAILGKERLFLIYFANFRCTLYSKIRPNFCRATQCQIKIYKRILLLCLFC